MSSDRAKLNFDDDDLPSAPPPPVPPQAIAEVTRRAGFRETPKAPRPAKTAAPSTPETIRKRKTKTGRVHPFGTRLRVETINGFIDYAERNKLKVGEVLEEALEALLEKETARSSTR